MNEGFWLWIGMMLGAILAPIIFGEWYNWWIKLQERKAFPIIIRRIE